MDVLELIDWIIEYECNNNIYCYLDNIDNYNYSENINNGIKYKISLLKSENDIYYKEIFEIIKKIIKLLFKLFKIDYNFNILLKFQVTDYTLLEMTNEDDEHIKIIYNDRASCLHYTDKENVKYEYYINDIYKFDEDYVKEINCPIYNEKIKTDSHYTYNRIYKYIQYINLFIPSGSFIRVIKMLDNLNFGCIYRLISDNDKSINKEFNISSKIDYNNNLELINIYYILSYK
uniref:Uncharacterized protein n=1 Tax=Pithovirus LCDPAC02 TaxID=2506601 RepID=A0A481YP45_9VIRU|nr:MAG: hypothetical protein LCDPAC02_00690 [Pithovirus LCDPAC02]